MIFSYILILLGILFIGYTVALGLGAHGSMFFLIWGILGCLSLAAGILKLRGFALPGPLQLTVRIVAGVFFVLFLFVEILILSYFGRDTEGPVDYMIIAGAQVYQTSPSPVLKFRLDRALEYLRRYPDTTVIVTGGQGSNESRTEASVMAEYLTGHGFSADNIILEDRSKTTTENMKFAYGLYNASDSSTVIVTNNFHLFRSMHIAKKQGIQNISGIAADSTPLFLPNNLLREFCGVCKDFLFGNLK